MLPESCVVEVEVIRWGAIRKVLLVVDGCGEVRSGFVIRGKMARNAMRRDADNAKAAAKKKGVKAKDGPKPFDPRRGEHYLVEMYYSGTHLTARVIEKVGS